MPDEPIPDLVPRAELERAVAEAVAAEQRKRRRLQLALAAAVGLLAVGGAAFAWWKDARAREEAQSALAEVDRLRAEQAQQERERAEQARQAVVNALDLATDLRRQYRFAQASAVLAQAEQIAAGVADLAPEVQKAKADLEFVHELDSIRMKRSKWIAEPGGKGRFDEGAAPPAYRKAFAAVGINILDGPVEEAAKRVAASPVRADLIAALDDWAVLEPDAAVRDRVLTVLRAADPDPVGDRRRDPKVWADREKLTALAAKVGAKDLSPAGVVALAMLFRRQGLDPAPLLREAVALHPHDFQLMFTAGQLAVGREPGETIRWYQAALALRPDNVAGWVNMGVSLQAKGDLDGAIAAFREAIRLDPANAVSHLNLGNVLRAKGDRDAATAAFREALRLDPKNEAARAALEAPKP